jgi:uncharacterized protein
MFAVLFYESAADVRERAPEHMPGHHAVIEAYHARGDLVLVGPFEDPVRDGAMTVFRSKEAAEAFAAEDPFVVHGLVVRWEIKGWNEFLTAQDATSDDLSAAG